MKKVTCYCMTYAKPPRDTVLLEEAIHSFLIQDYPAKELIVLNDCPCQELVFDHPQVRVINCPTRYATIGEKCNAAIQAGTGDLICSWDDDDISLAHRLSLSVDILAEHSYYNPLSYFYFDGHRFHSDHPMGYAHNCSIFTRAAWEKAGKYPVTSKAQDAIMHGRLLQLGDCVLERLPREQWFFIYRWGLHGLHLSGLSDCDKYYAEIGGRQQVAGIFRLEPKWLLDYQAEVDRLP